MGAIYDEEDYEQPKTFSDKSTRVLEAYGTNLNKLAVENKIDPIIGRDEEIRQIIQILCRRKKNNPVLLGEPGVGKTAIIEGLALKISTGEVPLPLKDKIIYTIELSTIVSGTKFRGEFEQRMKAIVDELILNPNVIIFIDEIHTLMGAGAAGGSLDASNIIKPALARGEIRCIGATTYDEYRESIEGDGALERRFQQVTIDEPTIEETNEILNRIKDKYSDFHATNYSDDIISLIVKLSDQYLTNQYFPDKAIDIMDEVGSYKLLNTSKPPIKIKKLQNKLKTLESKKLKAADNGDYEKAAELRDECNELKKNINIELGKWKRSLKKNKTDITTEDVLNVISKKTSIPLEKISDKENDNLLGIRNYLKDTVIGQEEAVDKVSTTIQRNRIGIRRKNRTIGNFIFLGPTGTGKTFLAKKICDYLFNNEDSLIRVDMSEYVEPHSVSKLIGSPPGYVGYEEGGILTEQVKRNPYSVILFDEIEKAHPLIFNILLQVMDEGQLTDSLGRTVNFRNCLIILTSNIGIKKLEEFGTGMGFKTKSTIVQQDEVEKEILNKAVNKKFSPEFLNRIDEIIIFNRLNKESLYKILDNELELLEDNLLDVGNYTLKVSKAAKNILVERGFNPKFGARPLRRIIEKLIENKIAEMILNKELKENMTIKAVAKNGEIYLKGE